MLVTDAFVAAVRADKPWDLVFEGKVFKTVRARELWERIMRAAFDYAEPGVIFIDRVNCAEQPRLLRGDPRHQSVRRAALPPYGATCWARSSAEMVSEPFSKTAAIDPDKLAERARIAVRFLDNIVDVELPAHPQRAEAIAKRRIGLGVTGAADALVAVGARCGTRPEAPSQSWTTLSRPLSSPVPSWPPRGRLPAL